MSTPPDDRKYGRAECVRAVILPTIEFDALDGKPVPPGYGVATCPPTHILPTLEFDMSNPADGTWSVSITLSPPAGADAAVVARDLAELTAAVEAYRAGDKAALVEAWKRCLDDGFTVTAR